MHVCSSIIVISVITLLPTEYRYIKRNIITYEWLAFGKIGKDVFPSHLNRTACEYHRYLLLKKDVTIAK